jgi:hypothetical protein
MASVVMTMGRSRTRPADSAASRRARPPARARLMKSTSGYLLYSSLAFTGRSAWVGAGVLAAGALLLPFLRPRAAGAGEDVA